jgi:hypothetical protein
MSATDQLDKSAHKREVAANDGQVQWRLAVCVEAMRVGPGCQQHVRHDRVTYKQAAY